MSEERTNCIEPSGSAPAYSVGFEKDDRGRPRVFLRVPDCQHTIDEVTAARLKRELDEALAFVDRNTERRHKYDPNPKYPWFCKCGYPEHNEVMHLPNNKSTNADGNGETL